MMRKLLISTLAIGGILAGCSGGGDPGDVETAKKAAEAAPKSVDQLPADMPPEARRAAEAAMGQKAAMSEQMSKENEARKRAMQGMNR